MLCDVYVSNVHVYFIITDLQNMFLTSNALFHSLVLGVTYLKSKFCFYKEKKEDCYNNTVNIKWM